MAASSEPLDLQLQRERVARAQVEAALESTRLQLIEMEYALRQARAEATRVLAPASVPVAAAAGPAAAPEPPPLARPLPPKPRLRKPAPKPAAGSLVEVARAAEAIEKATRSSTDPSTMVSPMAGMVPGRAAQALISTLDLRINDHRAIVNDFVQHLQTRLSKIQACYGSGNLTELKWHVNWITTNADAAGFAPLKAPAAQLEEVLEQQQNDRIPMLLDHVIQLGERATVESARG